MSDGRQSQGAFTSVTELADARRDAVEAVLQAAKPALEKAFERLPRMHFARIAILDATRAGPHLLPACLVLATIHDGAQAPHLDHLAAQPELRALFDACGVEGDLRVHLEASSLSPLCFYNGHPGLSRELIVAASARRDALQATLQRRLTELAPSAPSADALLDLARAPAPTPEERALFGSGQIVHFTKLTRTLRRLAFYGGTFAYVVLPPALLGLVLALALARPRVPWPALAACLGAALLLGMVAWLRLRERADRARDTREAGGLLPMPAAFAFTRQERPRLAGPNRLAEHLRRVADEEDVDPKDAHNHLTHCSVLKAGLARRALLGLMFAIVNLRARLLDREGKLGGIPSIHFARWVLIDPGKPRRRLLFLSDYDGTWESYLGQFVDLAAKGLTGVWSNTERFPPSWLLVGAGARQEQRFKLWTRLRQVETQVVYSHYPRLSVHAVRADVELCKAWVDAAHDTREAEYALTLLQSPTRGDEHA